MSFALPVVERDASHLDQPDWFGNEPAAWRRFEVGGRSFVLVADRSRIYELTPSQRLEFERAEAAPGENPPPALLGSSRAIDDEPPIEPPLRSLSLAVAQKCNLGCVYCYAQQGDFGGPAKQMSLDVAIRAVDRLFADAVPGEHLHLSFLGGEPLLARDIVRAATLHAVERSIAVQVPVGFSLTTNGTLMTATDARFLAEHRFAVTVSLDGVGADHDRLRPFRNGRGSYQQILERITPLLAAQPEVQATARVTVTPVNLDLRRTLNELIELGFHSVGFSPLLASPTGEQTLQQPDIERFLAEMILCGEEFERRLAAGRRYPFSNVVNALRELHRGTHRPYPCGAGAGYFGVSADGDLFACHRFVNDADAYLGNVSGGVDRARQAQWLGARHVHTQLPCQGCWARYLCGGGCHQEVMRRGRPACSYIRGWLEYCLEAYVRLLAVAPEYFNGAVAGPKRDAALARA